MGCPHSELDEGGPTVGQGLVGHEPHQLDHHLLVDAVLEARHLRRGEVGELEGPRGRQLVPAAFPEGRVAAPDLSGLLQHRNQRRQARGD